MHVDDTSTDFNLYEFLAFVVNCFKKLVKPINETVTDDDLLVSRRQDDERCHIYVPLTATKAVRKEICKAINKCHDVKTSDDCANTIRVKDWKNMIQRQEDL